MKVAEIFSLGGRGHGYGHHDYHYGHYGHYGHYSHYRRYGRHYGSLISIRL
jgi:hypothetical protein